MPFAVRSVEDKPYTRKPYAPFMTSTLQQEAGRKLRFSADRTMRTAQKLYENGYITYMRTDSTTLSDTAVSAARADEPAEERVSIAGMHCESGDVLIDDLLLPAPRRGDLLAGFRFPTEWFGEDLKGEAFPVGFGVAM